MQKKLFAPLDSSGLEIHAGVDMGMRFKLEHASIVG